MHSVSPALLSQGSCCQTVLSNALHLSALVESKRMLTLNWPASAPYLAECELLGLFGLDDFISSALEAQHLQ